MMPRHMWAKAKSTGPPFLIHFFISNGMSSLIWPVMLCSIIRASGWKKSKVARMICWRKSNIDSRSNPERYREHIRLSSQSMSNLIEGSFITSIPSLKKICWIEVPEITRKSMSGRHFLMPVIAARVRNAWPSPMELCV